MPCASLSCVPTVLVIDDDMAVASVLRQALVAAGCRVLQATGAASLELARIEQPDVILLDILMPGKNGVELSQALRATPRTAHIPIISMSAHMQGSTPFAMEADAHVAKPFDLDTVVAAVQHWISPSRR